MSDQAPSERLPAQVLSDEEIDAVLARETEHLTQADQLAEIAEEFAACCSRLEDPEADTEEGLGGMEIGVAGLSHVLNRVGAGTSAIVAGRTESLDATPLPSERGST